MKLKALVMTLVFTAWILSIASTLVCIALPEDAVILNEYLPKRWGGARI